MSDGEELPSIILGSSLVLRITFTSSSTLSIIYGCSLQLVRRSPTTTLKLHFAVVISNNFEATQKRKVIQKMNHAADARADHAARVDLVDLVDPVALADPVAALAHADLAALADLVGLAVHVALVALVALVAHVAHVAHVDLVDHVVARVPVGLADLVDPVALAVHVHVHVLVNAHHQRNVNMLLAHYVELNQW